MDTARFIGKRISNGEATIRGEARRLKCSDNGLRKLIYQAGFAQSLKPGRPVIVDCRPKDIDEDDPGKPAGGERRINGIWYKIGVHNKPFRWNGDKWILSTINPYLIIN